MSAIDNAINTKHIEPYRRVYFKRKILSTGLFESEWQEVSKDVIRWGKVKASSDDRRIGKLRFGGVTMQFANDEGRYNDENFENSLWFQYAGQQRTLVKIEAGFQHLSMGADGVWTASKTGLVETTPGVFDSTKSSYNLTYTSMFTGIISGDIMVSDSNKVNLPIQPLEQVFRQYPATYLDDYTSTGLTASEFVTMVRDHTDGSGNYVFRPFFENTTSMWDIQATTLTYGDLNTSASDSLQGQSVWNVIERLAEAEQFTAFVTGDGRFKFNSIDSFTTTAKYEFHGLNSNDRLYGQNILKVKGYGKRHSKFYSRVEVQWDTAETTASYGVAETELVVSSLNEPWLSGSRILSLQNLWIPSQAIAESIATAIFNNLQTSKYEIDFTSVFVPHLNILDRIGITYDTEPTPSSYQLWDVGFYASSVGAVLAGNEAEWSGSQGQSIVLDDKDFRILSLEVDLDKFETTIRAREI